MYFKIACFGPYYRRMIKPAYENIINPFVRCFIPHLFISPFSRVSPCLETAYSIMDNLHLYPSASFIQYLRFDHLQVNVNVLEYF